MRYSPLTVCVLLALSLGVLGDQEKSTSSNATIPTIVVGQMVQGNIYKSDRYRGYNILRVSQIDMKYLFFTVSVDQIYKHLQLSLLIFKEGAQVPLAKCSKEEIDSCYLARQQLTPGERLTLVVQSDSKEELLYKIKSYWSNLEHIITGQEIRFMFSETEQRQIYHLQLNGRQFKELRIIIKPQTRRFPFDKVKMYGTFGKNSSPTSTNFDFQSFPLWEDSQGVYLFNNQIKDLSMNLILYGMTETVYSMKCELANNTHSDLAINTKIYQYLEKGEKYIYHVGFKDQSGNFTNDKFVFRIATFTGNLDLKFYKDQNKGEEIISLHPAMFMGDMQYVITQEQASKEMPNGLFIEASSQDRVSTFMMEFEGRTKGEPIQLHEHIFQFMPIQGVQKAYFRVGKFGSKEKANKDSLKITFTEISVVGKVGIEFKACDKPQGTCMGDHLDEVSTLLHSQVRSLGSKTTYLVQLPHYLFVNFNLVEQHVLIVVLITHLYASKASYSALEYSVGNRPEFLRENKPMESHVKKQEMKVYKYICQDKNVKKVKIHINPLYGSFQAFAFRKVPSSEDLKENKGAILGRVEQFSEDLLKDPIVIVIHGSDFATFSIVVQPITQGQEEFSFITLSQDVQFKVKVAPNQFQIFQVVPIGTSIDFSYRATGALHVCLLNEKWQCDQKDGLLPQLLNKGSIQVDNFSNRFAYVRVVNPSSERHVEVISIFHSKKKDHCELAKIGYLSNRVLKQGSCIYTVFPQVDDYQLMFVHEQFGQLTYKLLLCDKLMNFAHKQNDEERYAISKEDILHSCKNRSENNFKVYIAGDLTHWVQDKLVKVDNLKVKFIVQKTNDIIVLPDGVGYKGQAKSTQLPIKKFSYPLLNKKDTSVVLTTRSKLHFYAKVVEGAYRNIPNISLNDHSYSSPMDRFYFLESLYLKITEANLTKSTCIDCQLLIFVYSKEPIGQTVSFTIEVTQNFVLLGEGEQRTNYLTQNSMAYYGYQAKRSGFILVELSDNNHDCAQLYISHNQFPDENNNGDKSYDGELMFQNTKKKAATYYISVRAKQNCAYSIGANLITQNKTIFKLERGVLRRLTLKEGQVKYYTFKHASQSLFKIFSLHRYGNVRMYLNKTTPEQVTEIMKGGSVDFKQFQFESEKKNRLILDPHHKMFCKGCLYLLAVVAKKPTLSSLLLGDSETKLPISEQKVINDILPIVGMSTIGEFYPIEKGVMDLRVHSGEVEIKVNYQGQSFKQSFKKSNEKIQFNFTMNLVKGYYGTATVSMTANEENTVYSLRIRSAEISREEKADRNILKVNPEEANYIYMNDKDTCLTGYLKGKDENLFISFYSSQKEVIRNISLSGKFDGKDTQLSQEISRNVMSVSFLGAKDVNFTKGRPFQLCLSVANATLSASVMQTQDTGLLPQNTEMLVIGRQVYDIYPEGQFLLDVFECRGSAAVSYGYNKKELQLNKEKLLGSIGMPDQPHAIKIDQGYSNILLSITSPLALIRWLPLDESKQHGIGYYLYQAGKMKYDSVFREITVEVEPLKHTKSGKRSKSKIIDIKYNLYISSDQEHLQEASQCERYLPETVMEYKAIHEEMYPNPFTFGVKKYALMERYREAKNLFVVIVADLTLETPDKSQQYYRFVYNQQEIPSQLFTPTKLQQFQLVVLIIALALAILFLFVLAYLCKNVFVPMIARLRNRMIVQSGLESSKDGDDKNEPVPLEPPLSSDRHNINAMNAPETQVRMS